jgi:hypothetical protein
MNGVNKNEVDLLLRSLARAGKNPPPSSSSSTANDGSLSTDHLDADELNSYAEGVVPGPARIRYTEHLADCTMCRALVVDLTQAAGAANRYDGAERQNKSSFWQRLAMFLSPSVLRFAMPALVLTLVIGIGLFALRRQRKSDFVAQNRAEEYQPAKDNGSAAPNPANEPAPRTQTEADPRASASAPEDKSDVQTKKIQADQPPVEADSSRAKAAPAKDAKAAEEAGAGVGTGEFAVQPPSAQPKTAEAPPPPEVSKSANVAIDGVEKRAAYERSRDEFRNKEDDIHGPSRGRNNAPMSTTQRSVGGLASERGPSVMNKNKSNELETRTVLGKRFTRPGSVWIDTDYDSQATIKLSRGSEQFRALVADEPGIRAIAERLDGAVIVVWKSRAYRIQ